MEIREIGCKIKNTLPTAERDALVKKNRAADDKLRTGMFEFWMRKVDGWNSHIEFIQAKRLNALSCSTGKFAICPWES